MSARRILLVGLLVTLGLSALTGIIALGVNSDDTMWQVLWAAIVTAVACGLMLPLTLLTDRAKLRLCGFISMAVIAMLWLCTLSLIFAEFSRGGFRVSYQIREALEMSFGFILLMGIPSVGFSLLNRFAWARFAVPTLLLGAAAGWLICETGIFLEVLLPFSYSPSGPNYRWSEYLILTGIVLFGLSAVAAELLINFRCGDRRYFRWPGIAAAALAALLFIVAIWRSPLTGWPWDPYLYDILEDIARAATECLILAMLLGHINLLLMARLRNSQVWVQRFTIVTAILGAAVAAPLPFLAYPYGPLIDILVRATVAVGIVTGCGSVALVVLSMLNRKTEAQLVPGAITATDVTLFCPRCQVRQTLALGDAACKNCELKISIKVIEPRCPACGYLLYQLTSSKCPECGAPVREGEIAPQPAAPV